MNKYRTLYVWMLLPMLLMQLGIFRDYWLDFSAKAWAVHIHYWTGTVWYLFLIVQPYFATHGQLARHRTIGIIGMFVAGGVCMTALSMMYRDIVLAETSLANPEQFGPVQPWFFYGVAITEIVMITAFGFAVIKSILHRKEIENHAWWLISTVFIIMMPALSRGIGSIYIDMHINDWPDIDIMMPVFISQVLIMSLLLLGAWKYNKLKHPATFVALGVNLFIFFLEPIGRSEAVQLFLNTVIKG